MIVTANHADLKEEGRRGEKQLWLKDVLFAPKTLKVEARYAVAASNLKSLAERMKAVANHAKAKVSKLREKRRESKKDYALLALEESLNVVDVMGQKKILKQDIVIRVMLKEKEREELKKFNLLNSENMKEPKFKLELKMIQILHLRNQFGLQQIILSAKDFLLSSRAKYAEKTKSMLIMMTTGNLLKLDGCAENTIMSIIGMRF